MAKIFDFSVNAGSNKAVGSLETPDKCIMISTLLLVKISGVRMLEGRGSVKWGDNKDYISYIENTPMVFIKFW